MNVTMQGKVAVAAAATNNNVLSGQRYERCPFQAAVGTIMTTGSAAGMICELNVGGTSVTAPLEVNANNRMPIVPDDVLSTGWEVVENKLIQLTATNTTGGSLTLFWRIDLEEAELV